MNKTKFLTRYILLSVLFTVSLLEAFAQNSAIDRLNNGVNSNNAASQIQYDRNGVAIPASRTAGNDSLKHRDNTTDSITIFFRYFDSTRTRFIDSSIRDINDRLPLPAHYINLGNYGTAAKSLLFRPNLKAGPDAGFHSLDIYRFTIEETRFYQTTRPYSELGYLLGSKNEQIVNLLHTQNIKPDFNMAFQYRFINSPGDFRNQNANHSSFRINGVYQSNNKRYTAYGIFIGNKLRSSENGGITDEAELTKGGLNDPFSIATRLGGATQLTRDFFNTTVRTGNLYNETTFLLRQQYDFGQKDSIVRDSNVIRLFYPRIRFQHTLKYSKQSFQFQDYAADTANSGNYLKYFNYRITNDTVFFRDQWKDLVNDFSIISFPEKNNLNQFLKAGIALQNLQVVFNNKSTNYYNVFLSGEYRNRTRNQKWDLEAKGQLYLTGFNAADYEAQVSLKRFLGKKLGSLEVGFQNVNRTPSFIYSGRTSFPVKPVSNLNSENISRIFGRLDNPELHFSLYGEYYLVSNYTYFDSFFTAKQEGTLFNLLHIGAEKRFSLSRRWNLYTEVHLQQTAGNPPLNVPVVYTRNRIAYEANLYKNLFLATGLEFRYYTPYKADNYSPFTGQFFVQEGYTVSNRPDINAFFNFRIKSFKAFVRAENLNTINTSSGEFNIHNFNAQHYPSPGFRFRLGIWWTFVN